MYKTGGFAGSKSLASFSQLQKVRPINANIMTDQWSEDAVEATCKLWELSEDEKKLLLELKDRLKDIDYPLKNKPGEVVRFLLSKESDIDAAEAMFRKMIEWRKENNVDEIFEKYEPEPEIMEYYPSGILKGVAHGNIPILVSRLGATDGVGFVKKYGKEKVMKHAIWLREMASRGPWIKEFEEKYNCTYKYKIYIEDLQGFGMGHASPEQLGIFGEMMRFDQDNYPEGTKTIYITRAPGVFNMAWGIIKNFFDARVSKKMVFCGASQYKKVFSEIMDLEVLPAEVVKEGKGGPVDCMPIKFKGGKLPK